MIGWREVVVSYPCEICGAGPGDRCITPSGAVKWEPHASRSALASANHWRLPEDCDHCHNDPPAGHRCPRCKRVSTR